MKKYLILALILCAPPNARALDSNLILNPFSMPAANTMYKTWVYLGAALGISDAINCFNGARLLSLQGDEPDWAWCQRHQGEFLHAAGHVVCMTLAGVVAGLVWGKIVNYVASKNNKQLPA